MSEVDRTTLVEMLIAVLDEACRGSADPKFTWFNSNEPDSGLRGVLVKISATEASKAPTPGGRSIAAHTAHAAFHLKASAAWLKGDRSAADWDASWSPQVVDETQWTAVRQSLDREHAAVAETIRQISQWNSNALGGGIGAIAHAAYHLGAIRQIIRLIRQPT